MSSKKFFITTAIPYVNAQIHIGNSLDYVIADALARTARLVGRDVKFLVGTDEHGQKIAEAAAKSNQTPQAFADANVEYFISAIKQLEVSNDDLIRTTDEQRHWPVVQALWRRLVAAGDLYKKEYEGLYCIGCESFKMKTDLNEAGECAIHLTKPEVVMEENYFFRLSKYADEVTAFIKKAVVPQWRQQELINFIANGLTDISFSRPKSKLAWGIPVPDDDDQVIYVWCDALTNYLSAAATVGGSDEAGVPTFDLKEWPANVQVIGKDIIKFHTMYWPAMLISAGLPLPETILVHGHLSIDGQKLSKSLGNVILPHDLVRLYGADAVRYFLLKEIPTTDDGDFSFDKLEAMVDADLANTLGNLFQRTLVMANKYDVDWAWADPQPLPFLESVLEDFDLQAMVNSIIVMARDRNQSIQTQQPWALVATEPDQAKAFLKGLLDDLAMMAVSLQPFIPEAAAKMIEQLKSRQPEPIFAHVTGRRLDDATNA